MSDRAVLLELALAEVARLATLPPAQARCDLEVMREQTLNWAYDEGLDGDEIDDVHEIVAAVDDALDGLPQLS